MADVAPGVRVRIHRPAGIDEPGPAMLWIHGGGMVMGNAAQEDAFCRKLANFTDVTVAAVDHRLAPEHPYPTPLEDCYWALRWLARQTWVDSTRIAVGGASAGGGFSAAAAQLAHDRGDVKLRLQMLVYPMLDDRTGANGDGGRVMWSADDNQLAWQWYLAGADPTAAVPARRTDLSGLPRLGSASVIRTSFTQSVSNTPRVCAMRVCRCMWRSRSEPSTHSTSLPRMHRCPNASSPANAEPCVRLSSTTTCIPEESQCHDTKPST